MKVRHENKVMGECLLKNRLFMCRFYVKAVGFMHYDFFTMGLFWGGGFGGGVCFGRLLCKIFHWKRSGIRLLLWSMKCLCVSEIFKFFLIRL